MRYEVITAESEIIGSEVLEVVDAKSLTFAN
jgi:hypothetical protein